MSRNPPSGSPMNSLTPPHPLLPPRLPPQFGVFCNNSGELRVNAAQFRVQGLLGTNVTGLRLLPLG